MAQRAFDVVVALDRIPADGGDDVAGFQPCLFSRRVGGHLTHIGAQRHAVILAVHRVIARVKAHAHIGFARYIADVDQVVGNCLDVVDRDGKSEAFHAGGRVFGGDDADHLAHAVIDRAARVALVDGGVDLEHVDSLALLRVDHTVQRTHMSGRHAEVQLAEGIADGIHRIADTQLVAVAQSGSAQPLRVDLQDGDVVVRLDISAIYSVPSKVTTLILRFAVCALSTT